MSKKYLEEKYAKEEVEKAEKRLKGLTYVPLGNETREERIENNIKQHRKTTYIDY